MSPVYMKKRYYMEYTNLPLHDRFNITENLLIQHSFFFGKDWLQIIFFFIKLKTIRQGKIFKDICLLIKYKSLRQNCSSTRLFLSFFKIINEAKPNSTNPFMQMNKIGLQFYHGYNLTFSLSYNCGNFPKFTLHFLGLQMQYSIVAKFNIDKSIMPQFNQDNH